MEYGRVVYLPLTDWQSFSLCSAPAVNQAGKPGRGLCENCLMCVLTVNWLFCIFNVFLLKTTELFSVKQCIVLRWLNITVLCVPLKQMLL